MAAVNPRKVFVRASELSDASAPPVISASMISSDASGAKVAEHRERREGAGLARAER
ncbi:MAG: hypothetical protein WCE70_10740 [Rhodanobacteraceae bacterium]